MSKNAEGVRRESNYCAQKFWVWKISSRSNEADGDSETGFKASFLRYLKFYELSPLKPYIEAVKTCDMSAVSAFFVSSVPNSHRGSRDLDLWGHRSIAAILRKHAASEEWPLIVQCSSIGSLGANDDVWFRWGSLEKMFYKMTHVLQQEFIVM